MRTIASNHKNPENHLITKIKVQTMTYATRLAEQALQHYFGYEFTRYPALVAESVPAQKQAAPLHQPSINNHAVWSIAPNPAQNYLYISGTEAIEKVQLYDMQGSIVLEITDLKSNFFDISRLAAGIYICRISNATQSSTHKLVVQH